jgi:ketosteroid isomerase-like protein
MATHSAKSILPLDPPIGAVHANGSGEQLLSPLGRGEDMVRDEVAALNSEYSKAVSNQDVAELVLLYAEGARLLAPNAPMAEGREAIRAVLQSYLDAGATSLDLQSVDVLEDGELVIDIGRYVLGMQPQGGDPIQDQGKYVVAFRRQGDGSLKIVADAFNSDLPATGA